MAKLLIVEDDEANQKDYRNNLAGIVGEENLDLVDNYDDAIELLKQNPYDVYILDGVFPKSSDFPLPGPWGIPLAKEIVEKEGSFDKIRMVSGAPSILSEAKELGVTKLYFKGNPAEEGQKPLSQITNDLAQELNS